MKTATPPTEQPSLELAAQPKQALATQEGGEISIAQLIDKLASTPSLSLEAVSVVERLVALQERRDEQQRKERFDNALAECQSLMPRVQKNGVISMGAKGSIPYARLEDLDSCIRPIYSPRGFSVRYDAPTALSGTAGVDKIRLVAHFACAGHTEKLEITLPPDTGPGRSPVQAVKASITAGRRHLLEMFFNVLEEGADEAFRQEENKAITQEQADDIRSKLQEIESDKGRYNIMMAKFLRIYKIGTVEEMKAMDLKDAHNRIESERMKPR